jgi:hypothetical protein
MYQVMPNVRTTFRDIWLFDRLMAFYSGWVLLPKQKYEVIVRDHRCLVPDFSGRIGPFGRGKE